MKFLAILLIVLSSFAAKAQLNSEKLVGTWVLTDFFYGGNNTVPQLQGFTRYKLYTLTHFAVVEIRPSIIGGIDGTDNIITSFGTYTLLDSIYTERIISSNNHKAKKGTVTAKINFGNDDTMRVLGKLYKLPMDERWQKIAVDPFKK